MGFGDRRATKLVPLRAVESGMAAEGRDCKKCATLFRGLLAPQDSRNELFSRLRSVQIRELREQKASLGHL